MEIISAVVQKYPKIIKIKNSQTENESHSTSIFVTNIAEINKEAPSESISQNLAAEEMVCYLKNLCELSDINSANIPTKVENRQGFALKEISIAEKPKQTLSNNIPSIMEQCGPSDNLTNSAERSSKMPNNIPQILYIENRILKRAVLLSEFVSSKLLNLKFPLKLVIIFALRFQSTKGTNLITRFGNI